MPTDAQFSELQEALKTFHNWVIKALAGIEIEVYALQLATFPGAGEHPISGHRLAQVRLKASLFRSTFEVQYEALIVPAHKLE